MDSYSKRRQRSFFLLYLIVMSLCGLGMIGAITGSLVQNIVLTPCVDTSASSSSSNTDAFSPPYCTNSSQCGQTCTVFRGPSGGPDRWRFVDATNHIWFNLIGDTYAATLPYGEFAIINQYVRLDMGNIGFWDIPVPDIVVNTQVRPKSTLSLDSQGNWILNASYNSSCGKHFLGGVSWQAQGDIYVPEDGDFQFIWCYSIVTHNTTLADPSRLIFITFSAAEYSVFSEDLSVLGVQAANTSSCNEGLAPFYTVGTPRTYASSVSKDGAENDDVTLISDDHWTHTGYYRYGLSDVTMCYCDGPTSAPTSAPTKAPTSAPTKAPTSAAPVSGPTKAPTKSPTSAPTKAPTNAPTRAPTSAPTRAPTKAPTKAPTVAPTVAPINVPTKAPTSAPTRAPTSAPTTTSDYCTSTTSCPIQCATWSIAGASWSAVPANNYVWFNMVSSNTLPTGSIAFVDQTISIKGYTLTVPNMEIYSSPTTIGASLSYSPSGGFIFNTNPNCGQFQFLGGLAWQVPVPINYTVPPENVNFTWCYKLLTNTLSLNNTPVIWSFAAPEYTSNFTTNYTALNIKIANNESCYTPLSIGAPGTPASYIGSFNTPGGTNTDGNPVAFAGNPRTTVAASNEACYCQGPPTVAPTKQPTKAPTNAPTRAPTSAPTTTSDYCTSTTSCPIQCATWDIDGESWADLPANHYVWFNMISSSTLPTGSIAFVDQTISIKGYTLTVPNIEIYSSPTTIGSTLSYSPSGGFIYNTNPNCGAFQFLGGLAWQAPVPINYTVPPDTVNFTWCYKPLTNTLSLNNTVLVWSFAAPGYTSNFTTNYTALSIKPASNETCNPVLSTGAPGTPINYKNSLFNPGGTNTDGNPVAWAGNPRTTVTSGNEFCYCQGPPTVAPTSQPTKAPTNAPTKAPTKAPTNAPTRAPTNAPTEAPTNAPTKAPTKAPTNAPTRAPTNTPTNAPTRAPTKAPTEAPTSAPTTAAPTVEGQPTMAPINPTDAPTRSPTNAPTEAPTDSPTDSPTDAPTNEPTEEPTAAPTNAPTRNPTSAPTEAPTDAPTDEPTDAPTSEPTSEPTEAPTRNPTKAPTRNPTEAPTDSPTGEPTDEPTEGPTSEPTEAPPTDPPSSDISCQERDRLIAIQIGTTCAVLTAVAILSTILYFSLGRGGSSSRNEKEKPKKKKNKLYKSSAHHASKGYKEL